MSGLLQTQFQLVADAPHLWQYETILQEASIVAKDLCSHLTSWNKGMETVTEETRALAQSLRNFAAVVGSSSSTDQPLCNVISKLAEAHLGYMTAQQSMSLSLQKATTKVLEVVGRELRTSQGIAANYERSRSHYNALVICMDGRVVSPTVVGHQSPDTVEYKPNIKQEKATTVVVGEEETEEGRGGEEIVEEGEKLELKEAKLKAAREECQQAEREAESRILTAINAINLSTHDLVCCHSEEFSCFLSQLSSLVPSLHTIATHRQWIETKRFELQNKSKTTTLPPATPSTTKPASPTFTRKTAEPVSQNSPTSIPKPAPKSTTLSSPLDLGDNSLHYDSLAMTQPLQQTTSNTPSEEDISVTFAGEIDIKRNSLGKEILTELPERLKEVEVLKHSQSMPTFSNISPKKHSRFNKRNKKGGKKSSLSEESLKFGATTDGNNTTRSTSPSRVKTFGISSASSLQTKSKASQSSPLSDLPDLKLLPGTYNEVKCGSIERLVERLTSKEFPPGKFATTFLLTYPTFMTSSDLLKRLSHRFHSKYPTTTTTTTIPSHSEKEKEKCTVIQLRVIAFLKSWIEHSIDELLQFPNLCEQLYTLIDSIGSDIASAGAQLKQAFIRTSKQRQLLLSEERDLLQQEKIAYETKYTDSAFFDQVDEKDFARQLTLIEWRVFHSIHPTELISQSWIKQRNNDATSEGASPVRRLINQFNNLSIWVTTEIVKRVGLRSRAFALKKFLAIAAELHSLNNYHGLMEVFTGIDSSPVKRMKQTWLQLDTKSKETYDSLKELFSFSNNYKEYRTKVAQASPPMIPYIGVLLKDLTSVEEGNPSLLDGGLVNFVKRTKLSQIIESIQSLQCFKYDTIVPVPFIQNFLLSINTTIDPDELYALSLKIEPKNPYDAIETMIIDDQSNIKFIKSIQSRSMQLEIKTEQQRNVIVLLLDKIKQTAQLAGISFESVLPFPEDELNQMAALVAPKPEQRYPFVQTPSFSSLSNAIVSPKNNRNDTKEIDSESLSDHPNPQIPKSSNHSSPQRTPSAFWRKSVKDNTNSSPLAHSDHTTKRSLIFASQRKMPKPSKEHIQEEPSSMSSTSTTNSPPSSASAAIEALKRSSSSIMSLISTSPSTLSRAPKPSEGEITNPTTTASSFPPPPSLSCTLSSTPSPTIAAIIKKISNASSHPPNNSNQNRNRSTSNTNSNNNNSAPTRAVSIRLPHHHRQPSKDYEKQSSSTTSPSSTTTTTTTTTTITPP